LIQHFAHLGLQELKITDEGDAGNALVNYLAEKKLI